MGGFVTSLTVLVFLGVVCALVLVGFFQVLSLLFEKRILFEARVPSGRRLFFAGFHVFLLVVDFSGLFELHPAYGFTNILLNAYFIVKYLRGLSPLRLVSLDFLCFFMIILLSLGSIVTLFMFYERYLMLSTLELTCVPLASLCLPCLLFFAQIEFRVGKLPHWVPEFIRGHPTRFIEPFPLDKGKKL